MKSTSRTHPSPVSKSKQYKDTTLKTIKQSPIPQLIKPTTGTPIITTTTLSTLALLNHHIPILLRPSRIQLLEYSIVIIKQLPDRTHIATRILTDDCLRHVAILVRRIGNIFAEVILGCVFSSVDVSSKSMSIPSSSTPSPNPRTKKQRKEEKGEQEGNEKTYPAKMRLSP